MKILDKTTQTYKELVLKPGGDTLPIGSIVAFASDTIPSGWLLCDGSVVSRTTYSELFNAIGLNYVEDGVEWLDEERFPLPNVKGKTVGGGQAHNNLQPSLTLNYIIKAKNTVVVKGDVIQENGTASTTNVYSAKAIDNKLKTNITTGQEVATNESIDGKTVYCTRISINAYPGDNVTLNHNINNIDEIIDYDAIFTLSSGETRKMPGIWKTDYSSFMSTVYQVTKKTMQIVLGSFWTSGTFKKAVITIKYTKNT